MEFFKNTNYDFLGKKWPFIIASLILTAAGFVSLIAKGGPRYGIEFKGGMLMTAKFQGPPPIEKIRAVLSQKLSNPPTVQTFESGSNEVEIGTEGADNEALSKNRETVLAALASTFGEPANGKLDLNNASSGALAGRLREPLQKAGVAMSDPQVTQLAADVMAARDQKGGLLRSIDDLRSVPAVTSPVMNVLKQETYTSQYTAARAGEIVGPKVGAELRSQALNATLLALGGMLVYIWFRFEWIYGVAAVVAVFHDTLITIGLFSLFNKELTLTVIAALLTLVGYSMNDTIVIFDRIRENLRLNRRESLQEVINRSVNQTLGRTVMTSGLTFLTVLALYLFGGPVLHGFSFALVVGIIVGTYSSVFVASPILIWGSDLWETRRKSASARLSVAGMSPASSSLPKAGSPSKPAQAVAPSASRPAAGKPQRAR